MFGPTCSRLVIVTVVVAALIFGAGCDAGSLIIGVDPANNVTFTMTSLHGGESYNAAEIAALKASAADDLDAFFATEEAGKLSPKAQELLRPLIVPFIEPDSDLVILSYSLFDPVPMESLATEFEFINLETTDDGTARFTLTPPAPLEVEATVNGPIVEENATRVGESTNGQPRVVWEVTEDQSEMTLEWDAPGLETRSGPSTNRRILLLLGAAVAFLAAIGILLTFRSSDFDDEPLT